MGRITRKKAAEVAEALHIDEDEVLELGDESEALNISKGIERLELVPSDRQPLGHLEANSLESTSTSDDTAQDLKKSTRGKKGSKKGTKSKKNNFAASTASIFDIFENAPEQQAVLPDDHDTTPSPASEEAAEVLFQGAPNGDPLEDTKSGETSANTMIRSTRSRAANQVAEPKSLVDGIGQSREEQRAMKEEVISDTIDSLPVIHTDTSSHSESEPAMQAVIDAPASPLPNAVPTVIAKLRTESPSKRSSSNKENIEPTEMAAPQTIPSVTVPEPSTQPSQTPSDPIAALDALDEAVDSVNKDIPDVQTSPEKAKVKRDTKKAAPIVRGTKASQARISLAQNPDASSKAPTLGQPRTSTIGRSNSVKPSATTKPETATKRATSASHGKSIMEAADGEKKEVHIPHSKPRPVSLSFPTPPPRAKSTKAPTQSTFQLSGEAVAAKLKAAKEARQQKEAEEQKKPSFKARPVPASLSKAPSVRQTAASKARESIMAGKDGKMPAAAPNAAQKRVSSITTKPTVAPKPRVMSSDTSRTTTTVSSKPASGDLSVRKRPSTTTTLANTSKPRSLATSTLHSPNSAAQRAPSHPTKGTAKGKEVFNRVAAAKAAAEKEKLEKEAAAKKARADAAERGRQASRAWAEKQKKAAEAKKASTAVREDKVASEPAAEEQVVVEEIAIMAGESVPVGSPAAEAVEVV